MIATNVDYHYSYYIFQYIKKIKVMKTIQITQDEIRMATRPNVYRSKKHYTRKSKHKQYK